MGYVTPVEVRKVDLKDARRVAPGRLRTILRQPVGEAAGETGESCASA